MNSKKREDRQARIIKNQAAEIDRLRLEVGRLYNLCKEGEEAWGFVEQQRAQMNDALNKINECRDQYAKEVAEMQQMKKVFNHKVFGGRWWLIRLIINKLKIELK